ncbi:MAG: ribonuclease III [Lachnospiraceae bacterium]|nr:ribonuclease III [Lachnospiraceae bacterium]
MEDNLKAEGFSPELFGRLGTPAAPEDVIASHSSLELAFLGDTVHDLTVRQLLLLQANRPIKQQHRLATQYVRADAQALLYDVLARGDSPLTDPEREVMRRGRNQSHTSGRGSSVNEYRKATGFEALLGFLYLAGQQGRAVSLVQYAMEHTKEAAGQQAAQQTDEPIG